MTIHKFITVPVKTSSYTNDKTLEIRKWSTDHFLSWCSFWYVDNITTLYNSPIELNTVILF